MMDQRIARATGFSSRQLVTLITVVVLAGLLAPSAAGAAATLVTVTDGSGTAQTHVSGGALLTQTVPGGPSFAPLEGTRTIGTTGTRLMSIKDGRLAFSDIVLSNGDAAANFVYISSGSTANGTCSDSTPAADYLAVEVPGNDTVTVDLSQGLIIPRTQSTSKTCILAKMQSSGFIYVSWTAWRFDGTGVTTTYAS
jgi:hypothetical protein